MAEQEASTLLGSEVREGYSDIGDVRLHYVAAGEGPRVVLLHGFPEFWYGWRLQINPRAAAGFRVVAPDMRGYNLSSRPKGVRAYETDKLTADIRGLIQECGDKSAQLVGHDWGGSVAWATAMNYPEVVDRLAILNADHPRKLSQGLHHPSLLRKSWYYLGPELAEPEHDDVPNLDRVERLPDASHWVHHDEAERVTQLLTDCFAPALAA
jgi:epoxide hydrolase 4